MEGVTHYAMSACLILAGLIHLIPGIAAYAPSRMVSLYEIRTEDVTLLLLLRHRAVLFALLGAALLVAAFCPAWHLSAAVAALLSMLSFIFFARGSVLPPAIIRVIRIDIGLSLLLGLTLLLRLVSG